ncbi:MAG: restriction endonuclease subunit S [Bacteroidales bacterium]|nr:restriction endonuclease subunit S [Bacteroidales bacterium]
MNNWKKTTLGEVCEYESQKTSDLDINTYISTENMLPNKGGVVLASNLPNKGTFTKYSNGQTLVSNIRPYFKKIWRADKNGACSNDVLCFKLKDKIIDSFFYYFLNQDTFFEFVMNGAKGTKMPRGDRKHILQFEINLPPLDEQKRIADVLSALDDKIEINNKINENLEAQAQAIFKQWFVDFEFPDAEGKPYKTNGGEFIDSELGEIPVGWKVGTLENVTSEIIRGFTSKYVEKSNLINLNQKVNKGRILDKQYYKYLDEDYEVPKNKFLRKQDILLNSLGQGTLGRIHYFMESANNIVADQHITIIRTDNNTLSSSYLYLLLSSDLYKNIFESKISGSTGMLMLNISMVRNTEIIIPINNLTFAFDKTINNIYEKININTLENQKLSEIRDSLLPKLMSGEVRV